MSIYLEGMTIEEMEKALKPCPLCGAPARIGRMGNYHLGEWEVQVRCVGCGLRLDWTQRFAYSIGYNAKLDINFLEAWNRRTKA